ncbi:MAG TPA: AMP-binding protein [Euzebyales bacterium]|nr:AMP-binding protein [Euzebyales bacterium]
MSSTRRIADAASAMRRYRELSGHDRWSPARLRAYQTQQLAMLVRHARARSAFYREHYRDVDAGDEVHLAQLPPIDKATVMKRFDDVVTDRRLRLANLEAHLTQLRRDELYLGRYRVVSTGGSTGRRGVFVAGPDEWRTQLAALARINADIGLRPRLPRRRVATIAAARPLHVTYRMSQSLDVGAHRVLRLDATTPVAELVPLLNRHRPEFLYSYPSVLELLAVEQVKGRLRIAPSTIVSSGETHTEDLERSVRAAWDVEWFQLYGATEVPFLAAHCRHHTGLHLFEDLAIVEVVDEHDRPVPAGAAGHHLLVTNLVNRTQPLIRYALSDMVTVDPRPGPCGRPYRLLRGVAGRTDDLLRPPGLRGGTVSLHPLALRSVMAAVPGVAQYRIRYDHPRLHVRATLRTGVAAEPARVAITTGMCDTLASLDAAPLDVDVTFVDRIDGGRDAAGKLRIIEGPP